MASHVRIDRTGRHSFAEMGDRFLGSFLLEADTARDSSEPSRFWPVQASVCVQSVSALRQ